MLGLVLPELIGSSAGLVKVREQLGRVIGQVRSVGRPPPVLIQGETGTGKGLLARALHDASARRSGPFVDVNCAAIPAALLESEMFGFERGAFTDARQPKTGLFQAATRGSIFLDEIGLLPEALQGKLLKVIEERTVRRLGATRNEPVDAWVIAATSEDLETATREKRFRRDLFHRLAVVTVRLPPLRERGEDVLALARHFLARSCEEYGHPRKDLSEDAMAALRHHEWPGNVRELANVMERAVLLSESDVVTAAELELPDVDPEAGAEPAPQPPGGGSLRETLRGAERDALLQVLQQAKWNLSRAAAHLGLPRNTLLYRMERQGLRPPPPSRRRAPAADTSPKADGRAGSSQAPAPPGAPRRVALLRVERADEAAEAPDDGQVQDTIAEKVSAFGGRVEDLAPTHVVAVFGVEPVEDAPRRAALAALAVQKATERARRAGEAAGPFRIAVHVADCVVGGAGSAAHLEGPETEEARAVLSAVARAGGPGGLAVSAAAARLLERRFELVPSAQGPGGVATWRIAGPEGAGFAFQGRTTVFTGRRNELALLESRLETVREGRGQVVAVVGEPGMGKSRLLSRFREVVAARGVRWLEGHCVSYANATPYHAVLDVLRQACGIGDEDGGPAVAGKVGRTVLEAGLGAEDAPILLHLLDSTAAAERLRHIGPEQLKAARSTCSARCCSMQPGSRSSWPSRTCTGWTPRRTR
jgi:DNA-binding NtrC family response regulator